MPYVRSSEASSTPGAYPHLERLAASDLPADLSARTDEYLRKTGFGRDRGR